MAEERTERRLAAIMSADVAGYSRLMGKDEAGTLSALKALRKDVFAPLVTAHKGRVVKLMGDGALVEFPSVVDAVDCAIAVQRALADRAANEAIKLRIGINLGDIIIEGTDIYGDELLDGEIFYSLKEAQVLIERWRHHYNTVRPHSALGYRPPAPQAIVPKRTDPAFAIDGLQPDQPFPETVPGLT